MTTQCLNIDEQQDQTLINFLSPTDKGGDCVIIHPGSHSIKFGLASQMQPFLIPNVIAHPTKRSRKLFDTNAAK